MSDLVTTAIATGGTSFDTATCIGGHKQDPFKIYGSSGVLYEHDMLQTKTEYQSLELNTTLETYDATNAPNGAKPTRSPFADDANAYFVGDTNFQDAGNGLVRFKRTFSRVPTSYEIPYGLYSRTMPIISAHSDTTTLTTGFNTSDSIVALIMTNTDSEANSEQFFIDNIDNSTVLRHELTFAQLNSGYSYPFENADNLVVGLPNGNTTHINENTKYRFVVKGVWDSNFNGSLKNSISEGLFISFPSNFEANFQLKKQSSNDHIYDIGRLVTNLKVVDYDSNGFIAISQSPIDWIGTKYNQGYTRSSPRAFAWGLVRQFSSFNGVTLHPFDALGFSAVTYMTSAGGTSRSEELEENMPAKVSYRFVKADALDGLSLANKLILPESVTNNSTPTRNEYLELVNDGTFVASEVEFLERYLGNIYKIGQIKTQLK